MLLVESEYLRNLIIGLQGDSNTMVLNFGSQRADISSKHQPWILENIVRPSVSKGFKIINFDIVAGDGVDLAGDILNTDVFEKLLKQNFSIVYLFNVLEHVPDIQALCSRIESLLQPGGIILVSVPHRFPIHNDPIDNRFRPTPDEVLQLFPSCVLEKSDIVVDKSYLFYLVRNKRLAVKLVFRLLTPFYKFANWKTQVALLPYLFKRFQVTVVVLDKR